MWAGTHISARKALSAEPTVESLIHVNVPVKELAVLKEQDRRTFKVEEALTSPEIDGFVGHL